MTDPLSAISADVIARLNLDRLPFSQPMQSPAELMSLAGKNAVVTGGGGADLGQALVHRLASVGARVAVLDIDEDAAKRVAAEATDRWGPQVVAHRADVTDWDGIHSVMADIARNFGSVDILVNNAGGALRLHGSFVEQSPDAMSRIIALNFVGVLYATRAALAPMRAAGRGRIINIASEGGKISMSGIAVYNACKSAVIGLTRNLSRELTGDGVSVVAVCPGVMVGPHALERLGNGGTAAGRAALEEAFTKLTAGRFSLPEEVANMVAFLASDAGAYVHATAVSVGGGLAD